MGAMKVSELRYLDDDIVRVYAFGKTRSPKNLIATLFWGDQLEILEKQGSQYKVQITRREWNSKQKKYEFKPYSGSIPVKNAHFRDGPLLKVRFVDVGQGDAAVVESPKGRILLIDGGEGEHLLRYSNAAFSHIMRNNKPFHCEAIVITHGDADHFAGLTTLVKEYTSHALRLITAARVFHNGLVKKTTKRDQDAFGKSVTENETTYAVQLENDLTTLPDDRMNTPFRAWRAALRKLKTADGGQPIMRRLQYGDDSQFGFLSDENIRIRVLGPIVEKASGKPALRFFRQPGSQSISASHTINGHSIVLKLTYGNVNFLFGADLNEESEERLLGRAEQDGVSLASEILKVPHHGSADFNPRMLQAVSPVVSVESSGDENVATEYIHPRAGLVGALGKYSRATVERPLIYVTEMVAFFERLGLVLAQRVKSSKQKPKSSKWEAIPNAYRKKTFGIVHVRTDGRRVLVVTHSGRDELKESYAFSVSEQGEITFDQETRIL